MKSVKRPGGSGKGRGAAGTGTKTLGPAAFMSDLMEGLSSLHRKMLSWVPSAKLNELLDDSVDTENYEVSVLIEMEIKRRIHHGVMERGKDGRARPSGLLKKKKNPGT